MTTIYASGRQTLSQDDWSITKTATEGELTGKTLYFSLQTKNNSGYNIPIVSSPITINTNDKVTVTLEDTIRKEGEGWLYAVICCGLTDDPAEMNQVAKIPLFAVDQFGYPNIDDPVTYPITIDFSYNHQLSVGELLDEVVDLPSVNLINGIRYAVVEKDNNIYELDINSVAEVDDDVVLDAAIGRWILTSSFSNDVTDVTLAGGCNVNLLYLNDFSTVELPTYDVNGAASPKMQYWIVNDTGVDIEAGRSITLNVDAGGYDKSKLFDNKIAYIFHGFANVTTGELRTTYDESGENLLYINLENDYSANYPTVTIEDTLKNGEALFFSLFVKFDLLEVQGKLPNTTLSIFPELIKTSGTFNPLGTLFEKGIITKELNRLRVYPDEGLAVKVKSGSGIVRNYNFWKPLEQSVIGLTPNATNEIYVDKDGDVYLDTVENNDSVLRAIVKTLPIESKASDWSAYTAITLDSRLEVTVVYPCNADLIATIRANYPDVIAGTVSYFNVRKINVYVQRQSDNEIRKFTNIFATPVANQVITISDWSSGTVVTELPTTEQGLFNPVTVTVANLPTGGNMTATNYRVAYSLVYDGTVVSDIDHSSSNGCITEVQLTGEDLFGTTSFNTLEEVRNITTLYDGRLIYCKQTNSGYFYNTTSNESDDGHDFIEPNVGDGCWINVRRDIVSKHLSTNDPTVNDDANDDFLNGDLWLNTTNDKYYVCVDNTVNNAIWKRLIYATDLAIVATSGSYADLSNKPTLGSAAALDAGSANGVCPLDGSGKVDSSYLPGYVDDVVEYADLASLPVTGETGKIYITLNTNRTYRWSGSSYVEISNPFSGSYNDLSDKPTLGTAAALDVGTTANKVVQLDSNGKLPAVDGSQLTNISGVGGGHTIQDEGVSLTQRSKLNFVGTAVTATDNAGTDTTTVTVNLPSTGSGLNLGTWDNSGTFTTGVRFDGSADKVILPKVTTEQRTAITPLESELIYDTDEDKFYYGDGTTAGGKVVGGVSGGGKNFLINGFFQIWQLGTVFPNVPNLAVTSDRWKFGQVAGSATWTIQRSTDVPSPNHPCSLEVLCTTADSTVGATEESHIRHAIEGIDFVQLIGKSTTLHFWAKSNLTGTFCVALTNSGRDRTYIAEYSINSANTWEEKTIPVNFNYSGGTWDYSNGLGLGLRFAFRAGSDFWATANTWNNGNFVATANQVNLASNVNNYLRIAGVSLNEGVSYIPPYIENTANVLMQCRRYLQVIGCSVNGVNAALGFGGGTVDTVNFDILLHTQTRIAPVASILGTMGVDYDVQNLSGVDVGITSITSYPRSIDYLKFTANKTGGFVTGTPYYLRLKTTNAKLIADAEL